MYLEFRGSVTFIHKPEPLISGSHDNRLRLLIPPGKIYDRVFLFGCEIKYPVRILTSTMASLPPALDFAKMEEGICEKWAAEDSFQTQNKLSIERGDEVSVCAVKC